MDNIFEKLSELLKHGGGVEVIKPECLKQIVKAEAEKIAGMY
jgi:hypothetical protein